MPLLIRLLILLMAETDFNHVWSALRYPGYVPFPVIDMTWKIPTIFSAVAGIESIFVAFLLWRPKNVFALVGAGLSTFILVNLDLDYRYQFDFLPAVFYFAWATSVMLRKSERHRNWLDLPLVLLMTTLYTFASFHKLVHFGSMQIQMGNRLVEYLPALKPVCESAGCGVHQFLFWTVIPVEAFDHSLHLLGLNEFTRHSPLDRVPTRSRNGKRSIEAPKVVETRCHRNPLYCELLGGFSLNRGASPAPNRRRWQLLGGPGFFSLALFRPKTAHSTSSQKSRPFEKSTAASASRGVLGRPVSLEFTALRIFSPHPRSGVQHSLRLGNVRNRRSMEIQIANPS